MRKLTSSDKQEILKLYRETAETTSTLAERYDVSNSTISRLLKSTLPEDEYEYLVSLKRAARTPEGRAQVSYENVPFVTQQEPELPVVKVEKVEPLQPEPLPEESKPAPIIKKVRQAPKPETPSEEKDKPSPVIRRVRRRSSAEDEESEPAARQLEIPVVKSRHQVNIPSRLTDEENASVEAIDYTPPRPMVYDRPEVIAEMLGEELLDEADDLDDLEEDLEEDLDDEDYEDEEDDLEELRPLVTRRRPGEAPVQVLPLSVASLPKTCYLVIDRSSELITRPLKDFGDLGQIPNLETQQRTLPVFDNHRVAKRFSTKRDRVIKVPDSRMLHKARTHLQAKGITRLLIDGQVYSLSLV